MEHVICFLKGLNECYNTVRTQILLMEPLSNINRAFSLIIQQERQEKHDSGFTNQADIKILANNTERQNNWRGDQSWKGHGRGLAPRSQGRGKGRNPHQGKQRSYYHKMNHTIDECYYKHGYPPWYKKGDNNGQNSVGQNEWGSTNACTALTGLQTNQQNNTNAAQNSFTPEQMKKILEMIDKTENISHSIIQMHKDTTEDRQEFTFNLIFVQCLTRDIKCKLTFSSKMCEIQDNSTLKMIGCAKVYKGLYYLQPVGKNLKSSFVFSYEHVKINMQEFSLYSN
ncbi:uncharacterized protein LOC106763635 [Vigna radiata var. radiata]|uniref:Uncharacterized protein LOC106763635 n=1 Tax=Vigna radiata var. radiata TaxID=3916 RepID=A0A1S3UB81_VIGRR|nr:uncharacterized protein LOC106763635 [Vigna radiata var. radiata]